MKCLAGLSLSPGLVGRVEGGGRLPRPCKPDFVRGSRGNRWTAIYLSRRTGIPRGDATITWDIPALGREPGKRPVFPVLSCSARGLPCLPGYPRERCALTGTLSPLPPFLRTEAVCFLWHFPSAGLIVPDHGWSGFRPCLPCFHRARCFMESGLSSRRSGLLRRRAAVRGVAAG